MQSLTLVSSFDSKIALASVPKLEVAALEMLVNPPVLVHVVYSLAQCTLFSNYAEIIPNSFTHLLCSKLCQHNTLRSNSPEARSAAAGRK